jgi:hypothetical protein
MKNLKIKGVLVIVLFLGLLCGSVRPATAQAGAEVGIFEPIEVQPDTAFQVPISVRNVEELYAIDIEIQFDPANVQVEDADANLDGIQVGLGTFLDAGLVLYNTVDNAEGVIRFAMTQVNPSEPKSGEGVVLVLSLVSQAEGDSTLEVSFAEASTREGEAIPLEGVDGEITVSAGAAQIQATEIPVQDAAQVTLIPTMAPTATPTITPTFEPTPTPVEVEETAAESSGESAEGSGDQAALEEAEGAEQEPELAEEKATILDYWWVVLIVVVAAGGLGAYLLLSKKKN